MSGNRQLSDRAIELINLVIDGEATQQEGAELRDLLSRSAEARDFYESMREVTQALDAMPSVAAPGVANEVLERLRAEAQSAPVVEFRAARSRRRLVLGFAWAAAAVLAIGVALDRLVLSGDGSDRVSPAQAAASMPPRGVDAWPVMARVESEGASLTIRRKGDRYALQAVTRQPGKVSVHWDDQKLALLWETPERMLILQRRKDAAGSAAVAVLLEDKPVLRTSISFD